MKQLQRSEVRPREFEGSTPDEAVRHAREALGEDAPVRCWKTRRGGVMGFFAREAYVASLEPPAGALRRAKSTTSSRAGVARGHDDHDAILRLDGVAPEPRDDEPALTGPDNFVMDLVESMDDEVDLRFSEEALREFSSVLAQAEAALLASEPHDANADAETIERTESLRDADDELASPPVRSLIETGPSPLVARPEIIAGLRDRLEALGVPPDYLPDGPDATLNALVRGLAHLPTPGALPQDGAALIIVAGALEDASTSAEVVMRTLGLDRTCLVVAEQTRIARLDLLRRREAGATCVVVVEMPMRGERLADAVSWISTLRPDYVLGALSATEKRSDVHHWCTRFARLDALSLTRCAETTTPGELLGEAPIALVDGSPATLLQWVRVLLGWLEGGRG